MAVSGFTLWSYNSNFPNTCIAVMFRQSSLKKGRWRQEFCWIHGIIFLIYTLSSQRYKKQRLSSLCLLCNSIYHYIYEKKKSDCNFTKMQKPRKSYSLIESEVFQINLRQYSALWRFSSYITTPGSWHLGVSSQWKNKLNFYHKILSANLWNNTVSTVSWKEDIN